MRSHSLIAALLLAVTAAPALAGPPNPGPDVIVGDIPDCTNYGSYDGITYLYDIGTISCNVGNVNIRWQAGTPKHPVIAQNIYRYRPAGTGGLTAGRFEQIGMAWAKHGFYALTQNLCGTCSGQGSNVLGVGCSDPYDGGTNGDQGGLGPRSAINASTGAFPFSTSNGWPAITSGASRRLQMLGSDVSAPIATGASFSSEALYVTPDDAPAGNGWNNASWRPVTINAADTINHTMALAGVTHRTEPGIFAWKAADPTVRLAAYDVPDDGRFWLGHTATNNGNGTWHYEYALYNMHSDRSGGSFSVPLPPGVTITNAEARIIPYHSGEPYTNGAWTISTTAPAITISTPQTYAQDPNSSALRWGTMYNFRFDATAAPATDDGEVTIGLFKPGTGPGSFALAAKTPGGAKPAVAAPANDECSGALALHSGENRVTNLNATDSPLAACTVLSSDVWFTYTYNSYTLPTGCIGSITFDTCGSEVPTSIAVYTGSCPTAPNSQVACATNGSLGSCPGPASAAVVSVPATEGAKYWIRVGSPGGAMGTRSNLVVNVTPPFCVPPLGACCSASGACQIVTGAASCYTGTYIPSTPSCSSNPCPMPPPPPNDTCAGAIRIGDSSIGYPTIEGTNFQADNTSNDICPFFTTGSHDVWYTYTPAQSVTVSIDTCIPPSSGMTLDTLLSLHTDSCTGPLLECNDDDVSGLCGAASRITRALTAGTTYYIRVCGYGPSTGDFVLRVTGGAGVVPSSSGACCAGSGCTLATAANCAGAGQHFAGAGVACNAPGSNTTPCCKADFNQNGTLQVQDIFDYLNAWFGGAASSDFNGNGLAVQDIFDFLNAWFGGC